MDDTGAEVVVMEENVEENDNSTNQSWSDLINAATILAQRDETGPVSWFVVLLDSMLRTAISLWVCDFVDPNFTFFSD